jgi:alkanesulfonate monooxygenase SsuD/methylene tetrahydromethanopterin reductase-like flavin-dependent oxidoreductase (luciferase family)
MRFGFLTEGDTPAGTTHYTRYHELVEQVLVAERVGFDLFGASEQHLAIGGASTSSPESLYAYMMALTSRIRFSHAVVLMPQRFNHPIRVAERLATLDILSSGRMEAVMGRGNTMLALRAFQVDAATNRAEMEEGIDLVRAAFLNDPFTFIGEHFQVPPRSLVPKPVQFPHPPLAVAATSVNSHAIAGQKGLGVVTFANFAGHEAIAESLARYDDQFQATDHEMPARHHKGLLMSALVCEEDRATARRVFEPIMEYVRLSVNAYDRLADTSDDYAYTRAIKDLVDGRGMDVDYMINESGGFIVGDVEDCIAQIQRLDDLGIDDLWLRVDSMSHEHIMATLERFGKYVIPHFKTPHAVVRPPEDVIGRIRAARPAHQAALAEFQKAYNGGAHADELAGHAMTTGEANG